MSSTPKPIRKEEKRLAGKYRSAIKEHAEKKSVSQEHLREEKKHHKMNVKKHVHPEMRLKHMEEKKEKTARKHKTTHKK